MLPAVLDDLLGDADLAHVGGRGAERPRVTDAFDRQVGEHPRLGVVAPVVRLHDRGARRQIEPRDPVGFALV